MAKTELTYKNSGSFGDLIYALALIPHLGPGNFLIALNNLAHECAKYHPQHKIDLAPIHQDYFTQEHFNLLKPLLERQSYIKKVIPWKNNEQLPKNLVDTDSFREFMWYKFRGNYLEMFFTLFNVPYTDADLQKPWLTADPVKVKPIVIARTPRYRNNSPFQTQRHIKLSKELDFEHNAIFIGTKQEHEAYINDVQCVVPRYPIRDFKEMADVIDGSDLFIGNQTLAFAIAVGLNKTAMLETRPVPNEHNECYFGKHRPNITYF